MMPWKLLENAEVYINGWLQGYAGGLASIAGVLITDYWLLRRKRLVLADLYRRDGVYGRVNPAAIVATLLGCALAWSGLVIDELHVLFDYGWFVGTAVSGGTYWVLMRLTGRAPPSTEQAEASANPFLT